MERRGTVSDIRHSFMNDSVFQLMYEINRVYALLCIKRGKVEVDWGKFIDFELEILGKGEKINFPEIFEGRAKSLFEKFVYLLSVLEIVSTDNLEHCYLVKGTVEDEGTSIETTLEWGFYHERNAKIYCELLKQKYPANFEWKILPPENGPVVPEDALALEKIQTRTIDVKFAQLIAEVVEFETGGQAVIDFERLFELEVSRKDGVTSEVVQRIWDRLEMMKFVSENPEGGFEINVKPKLDSDEEEVCLNPKCLGTIRYFTQEHDAILWATLWEKEDPEYEDRIEVRRTESPDSDNGEKWFAEVSEAEIDDQVNIDQKEEETEDEPEDEE
jgi:hypothetical protein